MISKRFHDNPEEFKNAFARAWFKLTHRDLGPSTRYVGADAPSQTFVWQDPLPAADYAMIGDADVTQLKSKILASGLATPELVRTAWASASTFRGSDMRGGANGARLRLAPQRDWSVNDKAELTKVLGTLEAIQKDFNKSAKGGKKVSLADLIILGGNAAIEQAADKAGHKVSLPFTPGRVDATQAQTDAASFAYLEPKADGFRNYYASGADLAPADALIDKADMLSLTVPEMTVLVGGLRSLNANAGKSSNGVFTANPGQLSNDFFVNLLDMKTQWKKSDANPGLYEGHDRTTGKLVWTATPVDLIFGSNSELRAVAEVYASDDADQKFVDDFAAAWTKVMNADRF